jgi:hypothetical protein
MHQYLSALVGELFRALDGLPADVTATEWPVSNSESNPHFMVLSSCYQRNRLSADVIAFFDPDEWPVIPGAPAATLGSLFAPLVPARWLAVVTASVWAHVPAATLPVHGPRFNPARPYALAPLAAFAAAPLISEGRDSGGREKFLVNTREARAAGVEIVNNHGIYAHSHDARAGFPPAPNDAQTERALVYRLPHERVYHAHINNLKGKARWPLKGDTVSDPGVADHIRALLEQPCRAHDPRICTSGAMTVARRALRDADAARNALDPTNPIQ